MATKSDRNIDIHNFWHALQITVDGDTSTNDTCIGLASGAAGNDVIKHSTSEAAQKLEAAVTALLQVSWQTSCRVSAFLTHEHIEEACACQQS